MASQALIFGAGKIARGFLAHLLDASGYQRTFIEANPSLVDQLNAARQYRIEVLGAPEKGTCIEGFRAIDVSDKAAVTEAVGAHDLIFTAVGGPNLPAVGEAIAAGFTQRFHDADQAEMAGHNVNIVICENYQEPAALLRDSIEQHVSDDIAKWCNEHVGIAETQVLRSCIDPSPEMRQSDPLAVQVQDWWVLPCDADAFRGEPPAVQGLSPRTNFKHELVRKVYTYNCSNATISYLGYLRGYTMLAEAANDPEILAITQAVYAESGDALIQEFGFDPQEQRDLQAMAISKYQDPRIADPIERNCRDTRRKLSASDRLVGPAKLVVKHGGTPRALALAIAAALHYDGSDDPGTQEVQHTLQNDGLLATITRYCGLEADDELTRLIVESVPRLDTFNQRKTELVTS